jgi:hypothetical protein
LPITEPINAEQLAAEKRLAERSALQNAEQIGHENLAAGKKREHPKDLLRAEEQLTAEKRKHKIQTDASSAQEWHAFMAAAGMATAAEDMRHWEDGATLPSSDGKPENTLTRAELDVAFDRIKRDKATHEFGVGIEAYIASPEAKEYLYVLVQDL